MNNYCKGKNVEEPLVKKTLPFKDLPNDFLWMQVRGGSKIRNLLSHALEHFPNVKYVVWTGFGQSVGKTITCVEIMKRQLENKLHQITKICYRLVDEYWDPLIPELDQLVVKRKLPMIHILLSTNELDDKELGYQAPNCIINYNSNNSKNGKSNINENKSNSDNFKSNVNKNKPRKRKYENKKSPGSSSNKQ